MDPKSKAKFINSLASDKVVSSGNVTPAFETITDDSSLPNEKVEKYKDRLHRRKLKRPKSRIDGNIEKYKEPESVFADGLPSWDILPPQIMVRRRH